MNICLLNDSFPPVIDGVANVVMNYGRVLTTELGAGVVVGTPAYPGAEYTGYPYTVIPYPSFDTTDFVKGYRTGNPLSISEIDRMADFSPDIIHTHCPAASTIMARILRKETGAPVIFTYHTKFDVDIERAVGEGFLKKETIKTMVNNIEACDDVWVVSKGAGENLRNLGYEGDYIVMNNGVDFPKGRVDEATVREITGEFDLPDDVPMFLFVGRMMKYKGLPLIIEALKKVSDNGVDFRMVFVGSGADLDEMKQYAKDLGLENKILFPGPEQDRLRLRAWNTRADLFLFPSVYDTNGIVVREAAACGLASVLIKDSCASEGITDGRNGYLIDENSDSMAALLTGLAGDKEAMHEAGRHAMDEIYISWESAVRCAYDRYKEIHEKALSGELGIRKHQSFEYLMNSAANVINEMRRASEIPRDIYEGMKENFEEVKENLEEIKENIEEVREKIHGKRES